MFEFSNAKQSPRASTSLDRLVLTGVASLFLFGSFLIWGAVNPILASPQSSAHAGTISVNRNALARPIVLPAVHRTKNIEDIVAGDIVLAKDESTGIIEPKHVVQTFRRVSDHARVVRVRFADASTDQEIRTTDEHPFFVDDIGWVAAGKLAPGQRLVQADGRTGEVITTAREDHPEGVPVFNFEVEGAHTYFVSADSDARGILVHNACEIDPAWGRNRVIKELHAQGFVLQRPARAEGLIYINPATGERVRIMSRPNRPRFSNEPAAKFKRDYYYRRSAPDVNNSEWGPHIPIPND